MEHIQTVLLGLGGTGSRVVNNVAKTLREKSIAINDGSVVCAVLDTNQSDNSLIEKTGTAIPIIGTSKPNTIDEYLADYAHNEPLSWCPYSRSFGNESMLDGASEMRAKSRLAFMDTVASGHIGDLEKVLSQIFNVRKDGKVRVMIVCSLSGGTGAGMFIQTALWLRKYFDAHNCPSSIRGIFLLPDIFVNTISAAKSNPRKKLYYYANAYACIRELNAFNKIIQKGYTPARRIVLDDLFDSDAPAKRPVYDYSFFIDHSDANGASFNTIGEYEEMIAQLVYMQLYAPMVNEMVSVEDNLYRSFEKSVDPVFGSCGTSRALYPVNDVLDYCALRAAKDSLVDGWNNIDAEIDAMIEEEKAAERDGIIVENKISRRDVFIKLFDEKSSKTGKSITKADRLFVNIRKDAFNERREKTDKGFVDIPECKVNAFIEALNERILKSVTANGKCDDVSAIGEDLPNHENAEEMTKELVEKLKNIRSEEEETVRSVIEGFEADVSKYADEIIRAVMPLDINAVRADDAGTVYGMFLKNDLDGGNHFVHPVVAKYLIYKLMAQIEERQKHITVESSRENAINGDETVSFDNEKTRRAETREQYWEQLGLVTSKAEIAHFVKQYKEYNLANKVLVSDFEVQLLSQRVFKTVMERLEKLVSGIEDLFKWFPELLKSIDRDISANVEKNKNGSEKVLYVNATEKCKEAKYQKLGINVADNNSKLNESVVKTVYGKFCYGERPSVAANKEYAEKSIILSFYDSIRDAYKNRIVEEYADLVNINICDAIIEESDVNFAETQKKNAEDPFAAENTAQQEAIRHNNAIKDCLDTLDRKAVPFLSVKPEARLAAELGRESETIMTTSDGKKLSMPLQTQLTFWGFHPAVVDKYPDIEEAIGANKATAADVAYGKNELYCYRSIYGVKATAIPKFSEVAGGDYYTNYDTVINTMIKDNSEIDTPHLDKTWHEVLPYISDEKQQDFEKDFYTTLWRAIAYGRVSLDPHGKYQLLRRVANKYGSFSDSYEQLTFEDRAIAPSEISELIGALRVNPYFANEIVGELQKEFDEDVRGVRQYSKTKFVSNLESAGELNPVVMIVRYNLALGSDKNVTRELIDSLEAALLSVASNYDANRSEASIRKTTFDLCYRIFAAANRAKGVEETFQSWITAFKELKIGANFAEVPADTAEDKPE